MISDHHKTVFVHIPKCGGQSIEHMFLEDVGLTWETRAPLLLRPNKSPQKGPPRLAHLLGRDYVDLGYLSQDQFDSYFKFAIVRDPYKRVLSLYNYMKISKARWQVLEKVVGSRIAKRLSGKSELDLDSFVMDWLPAQFATGDERGKKSFYWFVRKQTDYVYDSDGASILDRIVRLEELSDTVNELRSSCGVQAELRHVNKSKANASSSHLLPHHLDMIEELYADDFSAFGYAHRGREMAIPA